MVTGIAVLSGVELEQILQHLGVLEADGTALGLALLDKVPIPAAKTSPTPSCDTQSASDPSRLPAI